MGVMEKASKSGLSVPLKMAFKKAIMKVSDITLTPTLNPILKRHTRLNRVARNSPALAFFLSKVST